MNWEHWTPIGHRSPRPRIETDPQYTPAPCDVVPDHIRQQIDHLEQIIRKKEGERLWELIVNSATGGRTA